MIASNSAGWLVVILASLGASISVYAPWQNVSPLRWLLPFYDEYDLSYSKFCGTFKIIRGRRRIRQIKGEKWVPGGTSPSFFASNYPKCAAKFAIRSDHTRHKMAAIIVKGETFCHGRKQNRTHPRTRITTVDPRGIGCDHRIRENLIRLQDIYNSCYPNSGTSPVQGLVWSVWRYVSIRLRSMTYVSENGK